MIKKTLLLLLAGALGLVGLKMAYDAKQADQVILKSPYRIVMYTVPKKPRCGEVKVAFRIQTQDYKIVTDGVTNLSYQYEHEQDLIPARLTSGPGKDFRAWLSLNQAGRYHFYLSFVDNQSKETKVKFKLDVLP